MLAAVVAELDQRPRWRRAGLLEVAELGLGQLRSATRRRGRRAQLTKAELGHLNKAGAPPSRTLIKFRDEAGELQVGDKVTVSAFERPAGQGLGRGSRQRLPGHDPPPQLQPRARQPRLAQRPRPGSVGASADPARVWPGMKMPGQIGASASPSAASRSSTSMPSATCCWSAARCPGPKGGTVEVRTDPGAPAKAPVLGEQSKADLPASVFGEEFPRVADPRDRARGPERPPPRHRLDARSRRGGR